MKRLQLILVTSNVYCVQRADLLSCSYFVTTTNGVVLVDSGMDINGHDMQFGLQQASSRVAGDWLRGELIAGRVTAKLGYRPR